MRRAVRVVPPGRWDPAAAAATVTLAHGDRYRRRLALADDDGKPFLLDLERPVPLAGGDALLLDDGTLIAVRAADEDVIEAASATVADTARLAWHLGNRHVPVQVLADGRLRLAPDPVLAAMLERLGARIENRRAPFDPETGAYAPHRHGGDGDDGRR